MEKIGYQKTAQYPDSDNKPALTPCYWCGNIPAYITTHYGIQVQCLEDKCRAKPMIGFCDGYKSFGEAAWVWNQRLSTKADTAPKNNDTHFNIDKNELKTIFIDSFVDKKIWKQFFPRLPYLDL